MVHSPYTKALVPCAVLCAAIAMAPVAAADPTATGQSADAVIGDLEDQGYNVEINWVGGVSTRPLSECSVKGVHNPDRSSPPAPKSSITVCRRRGLADTERASTASSGASISARRSRRNAAAWAPSMMRWSKAQVNDIV